MKVPSPGVAISPPLVEGTVTLPLPYLLAPAAHKTNAENQRDCQYTRSYSMLHFLSPFQTCRPGCPLASAYVVIVRRASSMQSDGSLRVCRKPDQSLRRDSAFVTGVTKISLCREIAKEQTETCQRSGTPITLLGAKHKREEQRGKTSCL